MTTVRDESRIVTLLLLMMMSGAGGNHAQAARLKPEAIKAWELYLGWADKKVERELSDPTRFLIQDYLPSNEKARVQSLLRQGEVVVRRMRGVVPPRTSFDLPDAAVHHWWGSILLKGIRLPELMAFLKDYDHHAGRFSDVERSRLLWRKDEAYGFFFRLKRSKAFVTVHYNTEQECTYRTHDSSRVSSRSFATKIAELKDPGTPGEKELTLGDDAGYLWRLVSWWRFQQTEEGVVVECESATLSRSIPGFTFLIPGLRSYLESVPKESLESILLSIRSHLKPGP